MRDRAENPRLHLFAAATAGATFLLLIAGGLVTSTGSGDAVPDWWFVPISFGSLFPRMTGGVLFEHGHRLVATTVGILTAILAVWLWRAEPRPGVRALGLAALGTVIVQGVLGGLRVLQFHPTASAVVHASLAQAFFLLTVSLAVLTSAGWRRAGRSLPLGSPSSLSLLSAATTAGVFVTLVLGAVMRHTGSGITGHVLLAGVVALLVARTVGTVMRNFDGVWALLGPAVALATLLGLQLMLGLGSFVIVGTGRPRSAAAPPLHLAVVTGHLAVGALLLAASFVLTLRAHRLLRPSGAIEVPARAPGASA